MGLCYNINSLIGGNQPGNLLKTVIVIGSEDFRGGHILLR